MKKTREKRLIFVQILVIVLFLAIVIRLSKVMLVKGDYYRDLSDNRKVKEVDDIASRGNIYDRNGKILASSIPSFTVQLYKDQMSSMDEDKKIDNISKLVDILEEDGVNYTEDFNLRLNSFEYKDEDTYFDHKKMPMDKVVNLLIDNNLIREFISSSYQMEGIEYETANTALLALKKRGIDIPCHVGQKDGELSISYKENSGEKLKSIGFSKNDDPMDVIVESVGKMNQ